MLLRSPRYYTLLLILITSAISIVYLLPPTRVQSLIQTGSFKDSITISGLKNPTAVRFSPDGRVFVAEKSGLIKVFDSLSDPEPVIFADLRTNVHNNSDRGLLGLALDPNFPSTPYVYVFYTHDAEIGGTAPRWGSAGAESDPCPDIDNVGCVASGRLSRLQASGNVMTGTEKVLIEDWFIQYASHSIGTVFFGPDGALYAGGGDGASYNFVDYGQTGSPLNPAGDPPVGIGQLQRPPTAEGGSLRSQDLRTTTGRDPVTLDGTLIRVDPATGNALPGNPLFNSSDPNARRIIAYGFRNPFRVTLRPGTSEIWLADVGWDEWEEINRIISPLVGGVKNFGWPCYEGPARQPAYAATNLNICNQLYNEPTAVTHPYYA
jgi:glucose/arabinose dehydrogenase